LRHYFIQDFQKESSMHFGNLNDTIHLILEEVHSTTWVINDIIPIIIRNRHMVTAMKCYGRQ